MGLFSSKTTTNVENVTNVDVEVNPQISVDVGTEPLAEAVSQLTLASQETLAELSAQGRESAAVLSAGLAQQAGAFQGLGKNILVAGLGLAALIYFSGAR